MLGRLLALLWPGESQAWTVCPHKDPDVPFWVAGIGLPSLPEVRWLVTEIGHYDKMMDSAVCHVSVVGHSGRMKAVREASSVDDALMTAHLTAWSMSAALYLGLACEALSHGMLKASLSVPKAWSSWLLV